MNKLILLALPLAITPMANAADPQLGSGETNGYQLVWQDLFDADELDTENRWTIEVNGDGGGNNELQYYTDRADNVRLGDDGNGNHCLILTARREDYRGKHFTSGRIISRGKTAFTHGKMEAAIRFPKTYKGLWPAFWMMGNDYDEVGWPACGETDIIEMGHSDGWKGSDRSDRYFNGAYHWAPRGKWDAVAHHVGTKALDYSLQDGEYHLLTIVWTPQRSEMYVDLDKYPDREPYHAMDINNYSGGDPNDDAWWYNPTNIFHKANFILFNLAVGGNFPGITNADGITALNDDNNHEASMYVNYVKIYQLGDDADELLTLAPGDTMPEVAIDNVENDSDSQAPVEYFDLQGRPVAHPANGIFIRRQGSKVTKIIL